MNYPENDVCRPGKCACICVERAICFFALLFVFAVGLILGIVLAYTIRAALAAIIVFAATMAASLVALLIYRRCMCWMRRGD